MFAFRRTVLRRRVIINTTTDKAFRGVLLDRRGPLLVMRNVELLEAARPPVPLDGEVVIERSKVDFVQVLTGSEA